MNRCDHCRQEVHKVNTVITGISMTLDAAPVDYGNIVIRNRQAHRLRPHTPVQPDEARYVSHHTTCVRVADWVDA